MNLIELSGTIKKNLPVVLIGILVILIGYFAWLGFFSKLSGDQRFGNLPPPSLRSLVSGNVKIEHQVASGIKVDLPELLNVYEEKGSVGPETIARRLGFSGKTKTTGGNLIWQDKLRTLRIAKEGYKFNLSNPTALKKGDLSEDVAIKIAKGFVRSLGVVDGTIELRILRAEKSYYDGVYFKPSALEGLANTYSIAIGVQVDGSDLVNESGGSELFSIWVAKDKHIIKALGIRKIVGYESVGTYPPKSLSEAIKDLKNNQGKIIGISAPTRSVKEVSILYNQASLKYLISNEEDDFIQPLYVFEGLAYGKSGNVKVTTTINALDDKVYK